MENAIEIRNLKKYYKNFALKNVSFTLPTGCIMGLVGKNGAGKSTTMRAVIGALQTDGGEIRVLGHDVNNSGFYAVREDIGVVFDELCMNGCYKTNDVNKLMSLMYKNWDRDKFFAMLRQFDIPTKTKVKDMSRGTKMKLSIAMAMAHNPKLLVLDEPTGGLDPVVRDEILDIFNEFTRNEKCSILISSHIVTDLEKICDYITFMDDGECLVSEEKDVLLESYGILSCKESILSELEEGSVIGVKKTPYGVRALVKCNRIPSSFKTEKVTLEDIFVYMSRAEREAV